MGKRPLTLYALGTPNSQKLVIMFDELLVLARGDTEYEAWLIGRGGDPIDEDVQITIFRTRRNAGF